MANTSFVDQTDYIESSAYMDRSSSEANAASCGTCKSPCVSCGGGCYGCKGSKSSKGADISVSDLGEVSGLSAIVREVLG